MPVSLIKKRKAYVPRIPEQAPHTLPSLVGYLDKETGRFVSTCHVRYYLFFIFQPTTLFERGEITNEARTYRATSHVGCDVMAAQSAAVYLHLPDVKAGTKVEVYDQNAYELAEEYGDDPQCIFTCELPVPRRGR